MACEVWKEEKGKENGPLRAQERLMFLGKRKDKFEAGRRGGKGDRLEEFYKGHAFKGLRDDEDGDAATISPDDMAYQSCLNAITTVFPY